MATVVFYPESDDGLKDDVVLREFKWFASSSDEDFQNGVAAALAKLSDIASCVKVDDVDVFPDVGLTGNPHLRVYIDPIYPSVATVFVLDHDDLYSLRKVIVLGFFATASCIVTRPALMTSLARFQAL